MKCGRLQRKSNQGLIGLNLAVCELTASFNSLPAFLYLMDVWIPHMQECNFFKNLTETQSCKLVHANTFTTSLYLHLTDSCPCFHTSRTNVHSSGFLYLLTASLFYFSFTPLSFLFCLFALRLERTRCSQRMKLGTSCFKCYLGWFLCISMVRGFTLSVFTCSKVA